jgi:glycosyltransferase involved in cell wall biosynthesis
MKYVLVTPAHNEEAFIEKTIRSVAHQSIAPAKWIIVSDRSTDGTDEIVRHYAKQYDFLHLLRIEGNAERWFGGQVRAFCAGYEQLRGMEYEFIGNVDADVTFGSDYYENILRRFQQNSKLGIAGGFIYEKDDGDFKSRNFNSARSVANAVQLFRRECYEMTGGYMPLQYGGHDWVIEVAARMKGWEVQAFPELPVFHHRCTGTGDGRILRARFRQGLMDYAVGSHPFFEFVKCLRRIKARPYFLGGLFRMAGFVWGYVRREERIVSHELVRYLRDEQVTRVLNSMGIS